MAKRTSSLTSSQFWSSFTQKRARWKLLLSVKSEKTQNSFSHQQRAYDTSTDLECYTRPHTEHKETEIKETAHPKQQNHTITKESTDVDEFATKSRFWRRSRTFKQCHQFLAKFLCKEQRCEKQSEKVASLWLRVSSFLPIHIYTCCWWLYMFNTISLVSCWHFSPPLKDKLVPHIFVN